MNQDFSHLQNCLKHLSRVGEATSSANVFVGPGRHNDVIYTIELQWTLGFGNGSKNTSHACFAKKIVHKMLQFTDYGCSIEPHLHLH